MNDTKKNNISTLIAKSLSQTRWESRIESVKAIRFQAPKIRDALLELAESSDDPKIKSEAKCLATFELENFEFLLGMTIWFDILFAVNSVSKNLQSKNMDIDNAINQLNGLVSFFENYRKEGFVSAMITTKEISNEMGIEPKFCEKRTIRRKKQYDENSDDGQIVKSGEESFRIDYFIFMVDQIICSLRNRFEQFQEYANIFGFLFNLKNLKSLDENDLKYQSLNLENILKYNEISDIDGCDLF